MTPVASSTSWIRPVPGGARIDLRVMPRSSKTAISGVRDRRLVVRVTAAPVDNAANDAVRRAVADALRVPVGRVAIVNGESSCNKTIQIADLQPAAIAALLEQPS